MQKRCAQGQPAWSLRNAEYMAEPEPCTWKVRYDADHADQLLQVLVEELE
jgi:hypothetical protein